MENKNVPNTSMANMPNMTNANESIMKNTAEMNKTIVKTEAAQLPMNDMMPMTQGTMVYQAMYPEIYFKLQPYVIMVCDQMDTYGVTMPTQDMLDKLCDGIYDDVSSIYPDLAEAVPTVTNNPNDPPFVDMRDFGRFDRDFGRFGRRRRSRGNLRDLLNILILSEFFRRRRR